MSDGKRPLQRLSTGLIAAGIVLLVAVGAYLVLNQLRGAQTRQALHQTPLATETSVSVASATASQATALPMTPSPAAMITSTPTVPKPTQPAPTGTEPASPAPLLPTIAPAQAPEATATAPASTATSIPSATPVLTSVPVRLVIPDLKIDVPVVEMGWRVVQTSDGPRSDWVIPKNEAGHHINSALLGENGNLVISGHNNIYGEVLKPISFAWDSDTGIQVDNFTDRSELLNGREIELFDATGQAFKYTISAFYRLKDTGVSLQQRIANGRFMEPTDQAQVTIITCWPPSSNTHRLVVVAVPATN
jgi:sortase A